MKPFDVYPLFEIEPVKASGSYVWDKSGTQYLDLYGGHAVISIGHSHPKYVQALTNQLNKIGFYSNSVKIELQNELADKLGQFSGMEAYDLFLCNSGAEANENALKLASFHNRRKKIIAFSGSFHGRTSLAVATTDDPKIIAPVNETDKVIFLPLNDEHALLEHVNEGVCAIIIEGIQGVGGVHIPEASFLQLIRSLCDQHGVVMILDEVQSGYGRSGKFFAHQYASVKPDIVTVAKGMGNGFPVAGVLISPVFEARQGMLGTTFGGSYLACAAAISVLDVIREEDLMFNAQRIGTYLINELRQCDYVKEVRGQGLMIGIELDMASQEIRNQLLHQHKIFTGGSSSKNTLRILPALNLTLKDAGLFLEAFQEVLSSQTVNT